MITDDQLYSLAIFLGSFAMLMTIVYHFLEVNAKEDDTTGDTGRTRDGTATGKKQVPPTASGEERKRDVGVGR
ncbi:MAG: hypothetical protein M1828_007414 [Chrysothrix sp. TS-e1954]|nr:MAG: hypothetical protein M1828_007414 [Chrysothrix sp. TS-e1954]